MIVFDTQNGANRTELETITIGTQTWAKRNLGRVYFRNGDLLTTAATAAEFRTYGLERIPACLPFYNLSTPPENPQIRDREMYSADYGYLYNYWALVDPRTIAPEGFRAASDRELTTLFNYVGGASVAGGKLKEIGNVHWADNVTSNSNSGSFNLLPGGRVYQGSAGYVGTYGYLGHNDRTGAGVTTRYRMDSNAVSISKITRNLADGFSHRCIKITQEDLPAVTIGTQNWTTRNLDITTYRDGTPIPEASSSAQWAEAAAAKTGAWCHYEDNFVSGSTYGKLYNWYAVAGIYDAASEANGSLRKSLAPMGYHIPTGFELAKLTDSLGGESVAGGKLKATTLWKDPNTDATNSSGFTGLPGGYRNEGGTFAKISESGYWWSLSIATSTTSWGRRLDFDSTATLFGTGNRGWGFSVRLISDSTVPIPTTTTSTTTAPPTTSTTTAPPTTSTTTAAPPPTTSTTTAAPPPTTTSTTTQAPPDKWVYSYNFTNCNNCTILGNDTIVNSQALTVGKWYSFNGLYRIYIEGFLGMVSGPANSVLDSSKQNTCEAVICQPPTTSTTTVTPGTTTTTTITPGTTTTTTAPPTTPPGPGDGTDGEDGDGPDIPPIPTSSTTTVPPPTLITTPVGASITSTGATSGGSNITGAPITGHGLIWHTTNSDPKLYSQRGATDGITEDGPLTPTSFTRAFPVLQPGNRYYYRAYATNGGGIGYGQVEEFTTLSVAPTVVTTNPTTSTTQIFTGGNVTYSGGVLTTIVTRGILWDLNSNYLNTRTVNYSSGGTGNYPITIPEATPGQTYHMKAYAINSAGLTGYGQSLSITIAAKVPTVQTDSANGIGPTTATMAGSIIATNGANLSERGFVYSRASQNTNPEINGVGVIAYTINDSSTAAFNHSASGLASNTQYFVKAYAKNSAGYGYGAPIPFTTFQATTTTSTSTTTVCARPTGLITGRLITAAKPNSDSAERVLGNVTPAFACSTFQYFKSNQPPSSGAVISSNPIQYSQLQTGKSLYLNQGTACTLVGSGVYWFQPDNTDSLIYFNSTNAINIVTVTNGIITTITQCTYTPTVTTPPICGNWRAFTAEECTPQEPIYDENYGTIYPPDLCTNYQAVNLTSFDFHKLFLSGEVLNTGATTARVASYTTQEQTFLVNTLPSPNSELEDVLLEIASTGKIYKFLFNSNSWVEIPYGQQTTTYNVNPTTWKFDFSNNNIYVARIGDPNSDTSPRQYQNANIHPILTMTLGGNLVTTGGRTIPLSSYTVTYTSLLARYESESTGCQTFRPMINGSVCGYWESRIYPMAPPRSENRIDGYIDFSSKINGETIDPANSRVRVSSYVTLEGYGYAIPDNGAADLTFDGYNNRGTLASSIVVFQVDDPSGAMTLNFEGYIRTYEGKLYNLVSVYSDYTGTIGNNTENKCK